MTKHRKEATGVINRAFSRVAKGPLRSVGSSLGARMLTFPITAIAGLGTSYILISSYGPEVYGTVALLSTLFLLIPFADLGMGAPIMNGVSSASLDEREKHQLVRRVFLTLSTTSVLLVIATIIAGSFISWDSILGNETLDPRAFNISFSLAICAFLLSIPFGVGQRILVGLNLNHWAIFIACSSSLVALAATFLVTQTGFSPAYAAISPSIGILISSILGLVYGLRRLRMPIGLIFTSGPLRVFELLRSSAPMLVIMLAVPLAFQSHRVILSHVSSASQLAEYSLGMQIYLPIWSLISTASISLWPLFSGQRSSGGNSQRLFKISLAVFAASGVLVGGLLIAIAPVFAGVVSSGQIKLNWGFLGALALLLTAQCIQQVPGTFLTSVRGLRFQSVCVVIMCAAAIGSAVAVSARLGAAGPILATALAVLIFQVSPGLWLSVRTIRRVDPWQGPLRSAHEPVGERALNG